MTDFSSKNRNPEFSAKIRLRHDWLHKTAEHPSAVFPFGRRPQ